MILATVATMAFALALNNLKIEQAELVEKIESNIKVKGDRMLVDTSNLSDDDKDILADAVHLHVVLESDKSEYVAAANEIVFTLRGVETDQEYVTA